KGERERETLRREGNASAASFPSRLGVSLSHSRAPHVCRRQTAQFRFAKHACPAKNTVGQKIKKNDLVSAGKEKLSNLSGRRRKSLDQYPRALPAILKREYNKSAASLRAALLL
ncbi:MAG: hypothetical protein IK134_13200, partial [Oscillospiraceae bacterium]|nr:hypothetical protein [Oscillospiraceae bacterium]